MSDVRFDFTGRHVVVTGASRGIGYGIARGFAAAGATLTVVAEGEDIADAAEALAGEFNITCTPVTCDITDNAQIDARLRRLGPVDVLVNNAGVERVTPVSDPTGSVRDTFAWIQAVNTIGCFAVTQAILPQIPRGGSILFTSSVWGKSGESGFAGYCASKHAIIGMVRCLAPELGPRGIRVNAVCPGTVRTEASLRSVAWMAAQSGRTEEEVIEDIVAGQCLPGMMEPPDIAGLYLFLASGAAENITGQAFNIDRGELRA